MQYIDTLSWLLFHKKLCRESWSCLEQLNTSSEIYFIAYCVVYRIYREMIQRLFYRLLGYWQALS